MAAVAPAVAEDGAQYVATNWKKIWKQKLRPLADKRYYTKVQSDAKYSTKTETSTLLGNYYTKAQSDAGYAPKGSSYTKAESDGNYYTKSAIDAKLAPFVNSVSSFAGGDQTLALASADQVVRSVSLMPPANGTVIVSSGASIEGLTAGVSRCSITTGTGLDFEALQLVSTQVGEFASIGGTRGFTVTKGSVLTVNLVCNVFSGTSRLRDGALTAIFAPS